MNWKYQVRRELDKTLLALEHIRNTEGLNKNEIIEELTVKADQLALELDKVDLR